MVKEEEKQEHKSNVIPQIASCSLWGWNISVTIISLLIALGQSNIKATKFHLIMF